MCVSGETSTLSVQRFDRGAVVIAVVIAVLNWVTEHMNATSPIMHREKEASVDAVLCSKRQFGTGKWAPASRVDRNTIVCISGFCYKHKTEGKIWDSDKMAVIQVLAVRLGWLLMLCGFPLCINMDQYILSTHWWSSFSFFLFYQEEGLGRWG